MHWQTHSMLTELSISEKKTWHSLYHPCVIYRATAQDKTLLLNLGITHVVNAADGPQHINTGPHFYKATNILYHGVEAPDCKNFDLSPFFTETADFIHSALNHKGKVTEPSKRNTLGLGCDAISCCDVLQDKNITVDLCIGFWSLRN